MFVCFQATGPFLHIGAVIAATALAWLIAGQVARAERMCKPRLPHTGGRLHATQLGSGDDSFCGLQP